MTKKEKKIKTKKINSLRKRVGASVKKWRLGERLVLIQVASKIKVSQGSLSDIERGICLPSFLTIFELKRKFPDTDWEAVLFA